MQKILPPATFDALRPWPLAVDYKFFDDWRRHPIAAASGTFEPANAWWLMDMAFLSYAPHAVVTDAFERAGIQATVRPFEGFSTECYVVSTTDWHVVAFRGTQGDRFWPSILDWATDFAVLPIEDAHGNWVHLGFSDALDQVWPRIAEYLRATARDLRPLVMTGHSLGGALATMAAERCGASFGLRACYTFGSPRCGDRGFCRAIAAPVFRVRNNSDIVTDVPAELLFTHAGALEFIDNNGYLHTAWHEHTDATHRMLDPGGALVGSLKTQCRVPAMIVPGLFADHAPINYATLLWNNLDR